MGGHVSGMRAVVKEAPDGSQAPSAIGGPMGRCSLQTESRPTKSADTLTWGFQPPELRGRHFSRL